MIKYYGSLITFINREKKKFLSFKLIINNGKIYAFNYFNRIENRNFVKVIDINGIPSEEILSKIDNFDFFDFDVLKDLGIDVENNLVLHLQVNDEVVLYDFYNVESDDSIFYKKHDINEKVSFAPINLSDEKVDNSNLMLDYASTNFKSLLEILKAHCSSGDDIKSLESLLSSLGDFNDNYGNVTNNLDLLFLSSQLLLMDDLKIDFIPENIINFINYRNVIRFADNDIEENNKVLFTDGKLDYLKLFNMIRNSFAHSNYKVKENGDIEFYDPGKNNTLKMHFYISRDDLKFIFNQYFNYFLLDYKFPFVIDQKYAGYFHSLNYEELVDYLECIDVFNISNYDLVYDPDNSLKFDMRFLDDCTFADRLEYQFERRLKKHFKDGTKLVKHKLDNRDIRFILDNIRNMGVEYFFKLGASSQKEVIYNLIKYRFDKRSCLVGNVDSIVASSYRTDESLTKNASDYINYNVKIELLIMTMLNNLFIFCYNQNVSAINTDTLRFPNNVYEQYMNSRIKEIYDVSKSAADYRLTYDAVLKSASSHLLKREDFKDLEDSINRCKNVLIKCKNEVSNADLILNGNETTDIYKAVNKDILHRFRDCLAHGRLSIGDIDINNITSTKLEFLDVYNGQEKFKVSISLGELLSSINNIDFLKSMLNDNNNFKKNSL